MNIHNINGEKAQAYYDQERAFWGCMPWVAVWEGYDGAPIDYDTSSACPIGEGKTEQDALDNLVENTEC